jgi:hypothetical protein
MDNPALNVIGTDRCENLRWKGMFIDTDQDTPTGTDSLFWCLKTQLILGPDGQVAGKWECNPGRSCYKAL